MGLGGLAVAMQDHQPFSPLHAKIMTREAPRIKQSENQPFCACHAMYLNCIARKGPIAPLCRPVPPHFSFAMTLDLTLHNRFPCEYYRSILICAIGTQGDDTLFLAHRDHLNAGGDGVADANGGEKFERLTQVDSSRSRQIVAQHR